MIIDTDVLIWYMRGNEKAYDIIESIPSFYLSVISYMELVQGMRNKTELNELRKALRIWNAKILYVTEDISSKAMFYMERHYLSHSLEIADSLIAATSITNALTLLTGNDKHYKVISDLDLQIFRP
ncbi:type II toxin-antitoxin system VapC family toxin [bacterium]|nr:type II toxin-antitoxin system VapC family toxin [bacterium]